jgi:hypothetical protein
MRERDTKLDQLLTEQRAADREAVNALTAAVGKLEAAIEAQRLPWFAVALDALRDRWQAAVGVVLFAVIIIPVAAVVIGWAVQTFPFSKARQAADTVMMPSQPTGAMAQPQTLRVTDPGAVQRLDYAQGPRWNQ